MPRQAPCSFARTEIAVLLVGQSVYVYYDTTGEGRFDLLLVDEKSNGKPDAVYRIDADGALKPDPTLKPAFDIDASLLPKPEWKARLGYITSVLKPSELFLVRAIGNTNVDSTSAIAPDLQVLCKKGSIAIDGDGDGLSDSVRCENLYSRAIVLDADHDGLSKIPPGNSADAIVASKDFDARAAIVEQAGSIWALYDTTGDRRAELALHAPRGFDSSVVLEAFRKDANGQFVTAPDQLGRLLLRPYVAGAHSKGLLQRYGVLAKDDGLGSFPDPADPLFGFHYRKSAKFPNHIIESQAGRLSSAYLADLDGDTKAHVGETPEQIVKRGAFDAEFGVYARYGRLWTYYDTDADNVFDLVLFASTLGPHPQVTAAYRVDEKKRTVAAAPEFVGMPMLRHRAIFKDDALNKKLAMALGELFSTGVEP